LVVGATAPSAPPALYALDQAHVLGSDAQPGRGPFDRDRRGTLPGQGAAAIYLETLAEAERRGIEPMAELIGCEVVCDANGSEALEAAVKLASPSEPGPSCWWAHGAGSVRQDREECEALRNSARRPTTSSKGTIGNIFECSGLVDVALAVEALRRQVLPPIGLLQAPDPELGAIDFVVAEERRIRAEMALVTSMGAPHTHCAGAAAIRRLGQ
jgi:3-oxoacyl-[acyl-carrier-protein] synthase II